MPGLCRIMAVALSILFISTAGLGAEPSSQSSFNLDQRVLWTTGNIQGSPEPPDPFTTQDAFPKLKLHPRLILFASASSLCSPLYLKR